MPVPTLTYEEQREFKRLDEAVGMGVKAAKVVMAAGAALARIRDGDMIRLDADRGTLEVLADLSARAPVEADLAANRSGTGRELFEAFRRIASGADRGASIFEVV